MTREHLSRSIVYGAFEVAQRSLVLGRHLGDAVLTKVSEAYTGRPTGDTPHITQRVRSSLPVNEALVAQQFVELGELFDPDKANSNAERKDLREKKRGYRRYGHYKIIKTLLKADADPIVEDEIVYAVADIAHEVGTDPEKLEDAFNEVDIERAKHILEP